jgi:hypothetical protein
MHAKFDFVATGTLGDKLPDAGADGFRRAGSNGAELNDATGEVRDPDTGDITGKIKPSEFGKGRYEVDGNGWQSYGSFNSPELAATKALSGYQYSKNQPSQRYQ